MAARCEDEGTSPNEYVVTRRESIGTNLIEIEWRNLHGKQSNNVTFARNSRLTTSFSTYELARVRGRHYAYHLRSGSLPLPLLTSWLHEVGSLGEGGRETSGRPGSGRSA